MRVGCFTPLLSQFPLEKVFEKLKSLNISTVELGTGNYPGDPHCKLSMLQDKAALKDFKQKLADNGFSISALSCHGNPLHPERGGGQGLPGGRASKTILLAEKLGVPDGDRLLRMPGRQRQGEVSELGDLPVAAGISGRFSSGSGKRRCTRTGSSRRSSPPTTA